MCGIIVSASLCLCLHLCKSQCWYMFLNDRQRVCVCLCVCDFVCVCKLLEQEEWFHLDLIHLGGNLLVNRLVHELRRVDLGLFVCNIAVNLAFLGRPQIHRLTTNRAPQKICLLCKKMCALRISSVFRILKIPTPDFLPHSTHIWRRCPLLQYCYQTDAIFAAKQFCATLISAE